MNSYELQHHNQMKIIKLTNMTKNTVNYQIFVRI